MNERSNHSESRSNIGSRREQTTKPNVLSTPSRREQSSSTDRLNYIEKAERRVKEKVTSAVNPCQQFAVGCDMRIVALGIVGQNIAGRFGGIAECEKFCETRAASSY